MVIHLELKQSWTHLKEISETGLLVSAHHDWRLVNLEVFDISKKGKVKKIYSFEEACGGCRVPF